MAVLLALMQSRELLLMCLQCKLVSVLESSSAKDYRSTIAV
jgi:hypothetical protein